MSYITDPLKECIISYVRGQVPDKRSIKKPRISTQFASVNLSHIILKVF